MRFILRHLVTLALFANISAAAQVADDPEAYDQKWAKTIPNHAQYEVCAVAPDVLHPVHAKDFHHPRRIRQASIAKGKTMQVYEQMNRQRLNLDTYGGAAQ